jgi:hypothetical protein
MSMVRVLVYILSPILSVLTYMYITPLFGITGLVKFLAVSMCMYPAIFLFCTGIFADKDPAEVDGLIAGSPIEKE